MRDLATPAGRIFSAAAAIVALTVSLGQAVEPKPAPKPAARPDASADAKAEAMKKFKASYGKWRQLQADGDYFAAFEQAATSLELVTKAHSPTHLYAARVFDELGELQVLLNNFPEAEALLNRAFAIRHDQPEEDTPALAATQLNRARLFAATRQFDAAGEVLTDCLRIYRLKESDSAAAIVAALTVQSMLHADMYEPELCRTEAQQAVDLAAKLKPADAVLAAEAQIAQARALNLAGQYRDARKQIAAACDVLGKALKPDHPRTLWARYDLTRVLERTGEAELAERTLYEVLQAAETRLGPDHLLVSYCLNDLGLIAEDRSDFTAARRHLTRALEIKEFRLGEDNYDLAISLGNLAGVMLSTGQADAAAPLFKRCLEINEEVLGKKSAAYAHSQISMALIAGRMGEGEECEQRLREAHDILKDRLGEDHPDTAVAQYHLARVLVTKEEYDDAEKALSKVLEVYRDRLDPLDERWTSARFLAADLRHRQGHTPEAREQLATLLSDVERGRGPDDPRTVRVVTTLARYAAAAGDWDEVLALSNRQRHTARHQVATVLPTLSSQAQLQYLRSTDRPNLQSALAWAWARAADPKFATASAEWLTNGKGVAVEALTRQTIATRDVTDEDALSLRRRVLDLNRRMAGLIFTRPSDDDWFERQKELSELEEQHADLSQMLAEFAPAPADEAHWIGLDEVRRQIPPDAVLVEFSRLRRPENDEGQFSIDELSEERYVAWIIPPAGKGEVELVDLDLVERVDEMADFLRDALFESFVEATEEDESRAEERFGDATETLSRSLLRPLEKRLADVKHWILSPDGMLWLVPWGALPYDEGGYVIERHQLTLVTSARDLVREPAEFSSEPALVVANPNYNLGLKEVEDRPPFALLPQTVDEAKSIVDPVTKITAVAPRLLLGDEALEATVKSIARPSLLMFSTHGFSFGGGYSSQSNPLAWCGLAFAGANGRQADPRGEDGVLSGLEVVGLDLRGTRLVVLSACDTARGKITSGEGVASLQQAFLLAGAQQVVSTIWPVPVDGTVELVIKFFNTLADGTDTSTALREAQLHLIKSRREKVKGAHPMHWGAFTVTGWAGQKVEGGK